MLLKLLLLKVVPFRLLIFIIGLLMLKAKVANATKYYDSKSLRRHLVSLAKQEPNLVRVDSIAWSMGRLKVWMVELGEGAEQDRKTRPAILVVAGIEGNDLAGCSVAVSWVEHLTQQYRTNTHIHELLQNTTIYVIPRLNPDAAENFFTKPKFERTSNNKPVDDDHDGLIDEDGPEDLNNDGLITSMRIEDPEGEYILDPLQERLLLKADHLKGEVGAWRYLTEGVDNDHDELWNEDGPGGVNFNRNFPFNFKFFAPDAGIHQVSEAETRALADFIIEHPNIAVIVTYGQADNLLKVPKAAVSAGRHKPMTAIDEKDLDYFRVFGDIYRETLGLNEQIKLEGISPPGTFSDWMYFHRGRLSLAARPWSPEIAIELCKAAEKKASHDEHNDKQTVGCVNKGSQEKKQDRNFAFELEERKTKGEKTDIPPQPDTDKRNQKAREQLKWFDRYAPEAFIPWQPVEHPDFPNQRVEVGGYAPYCLTNPPVRMLEEIATKHADFLTKVAQRLPHIGIRKVESRRLGQSIYEVKIQIENTGFLPTSLAHGQTTGEVYPTRLIMKLEDESFLSGTRVSTLPALRGSGGMIEVRYVIRVPNRSRINFKVISMLAGQTTGTIDLTKDK